MAKVRPVVKSIYNFPDNPSVNSTVDDSQMTSIIDDLVEKKDIDKLSLILTSNSHQQFLLENNEAVLKGRALLAFHKGELRLVSLYKTLTVINSLKTKHLINILHDLINTIIVF